MKRGTRAAWVRANEGLYVCECGCNGVIPLKPEHFNVGVPKYLRGHNLSHKPPRKKPPKPRLPCACGCGQVATPGKRYISGHNSTGRRLSADARERIAASKRGANNPSFGKRPPNYVGRQIRGDGYIMETVREHPFGGVRRTVMQHRLVLEEHLRTTKPASEFLVRVGDELYLRPDIEVHHINGIKDDNRVENLQPMTKAEHTALHRHQLTAARWPNR